MKQNLTLTLEAGLLKAARKLAIEKDTSVNQMVRDYLAQLVEQTEAPHRAAAEAFRKAARASKVRLAGATWTRDELYDRSL